MSEKRGLTGKLKYDFNTAGVCEVMHTEGVWHRVTAKQFRSFDGPRRLTVITGPALLGRPQDEEKTTYDYQGPVYLFESNKEVKPANSRTFRYNI